MLEINGSIAEIATENNNGRDKKVIEVHAGRNNVVFVEFQGKMMNKVNEFSNGDKVNIKFRFNGKVSKLGRRYNNIIGKSITLLN